MSDWHINIVFPLLTSFIVTYLAIPKIIHFSKLSRLFAFAGERNSHQGEIPIFGGVAIFAGLLFSLVFWAELEEIQFILDNAGMYMTTPPTRDDIKSVFSGLRPLAAPENDGSATKEISRHHKVIVSTSGMVSILGGKWTTYRKMAEDIINTAQSVGGLPERGCITHNLPVHGYDYNSDWTNPLHGYGVDIDKIIKLDPEGNTSLSKEVHLTKNQVIWAIREEMAMTVEDVLARRTRVLFLNASESLILAPTVAAIMGKEMGKDSSWITTQIENYTTLTQNYLMK